MNISPGHGSMGHKHHAHCPAFLFLFFLSLLIYLFLILFVFFSHAMMLNIKKPSSLFSPPTPSSLHLGSKGSKAMHIHLTRANTQHTRIHRAHISHLASSRLVLFWLSIGQRGGVDQATPCPGIIPEHRLYTHRTPHHIASQLMHRTHRCLGVDVGPMPSRCP